MKTYLLVHLVGIFLVTKLYAQCELQLGTDKTFCENEFKIGNTLLLDQNPIIIDGIPPYAFKWTADYWAYGIFHHSASFYLNDTTLANPFLIQPAENNEWITFSLELFDSAGNTCSDSIKIRFSTFAWIPTNGFITINQGDTVQFPGFSFVDGGVPPLEFNFIPTEGLSNPNDLSSFAFPDTSTVYSMFAIDSTGCVSDTFPIYYITVLTTGLNEFFANRSTLKIFPNPASHLLNIEFDKELDSRNYRIHIFELSGKEVISTLLTNAKTVINLEKLNQGIYLYSVSENQTILEVGKIIKK